MQWRQKGGGGGGGGGGEGKIRCEVGTAIRELAHSKHCVPQVGDVRNSFGERSGSGYFHLEDTSKKGGGVELMERERYQHLKVIGFLDVKQNHCYKIARISDPELWVNRFNCTERRQRHRQQQQRRRRRGGCARRFLCVWFSKCGGEIRYFRNQLSVLIACGRKKLGSLSEENNENLRKIVLGVGLKIEPDFCCAIEKSKALRNSSEEK
jgi:hypothetical protein